ncbi:hypothetical protein Moror_2590 [Moniliophthora roreri MCA 2997]|uniref:Uncharacterized protein n=1 Tax=Moniliophthora roreri (strain MCA 2997) TaxID=1381753 RepID=V2XFC3_MONRO|nr:hypothetical protein Moror_2590 [Moniliophthora roreri MCA 2997]
MAGTARGTALVSRFTRASFASIQVPFNNSAFFWLYGSYQSLVASHGTQPKLNKCVNSESVFMLNHRRPYLNMEYKESRIGKTTYRGEPPHNQLRKPSTASSNTDAIAQADCKEDDSGHTCSSSCMIIDILPTGSGLKVEPMRVHIKSLRGGTFALGIPHYPAPVSSPYVLAPTETALFYFYQPAARLAISETATYDDLLTTTFLASCSLLPRMIPSVICSWITASSDILDTVWLTSSNEDLDEFYTQDSGASRASGSNAPSSPKAGKSTRILTE